MKALALKYRPKTFDDLVEQGPIKQILESQVSTSTHQNSYLFTGGAGTGKTTSARIMANEINKGEGNPIEIDAASNTGVDNVREIITDAKFKSLDSEYKVYIIDECHMLSTGAWNAMLKILEEPPAKTIFILCTTDPQKIPATIISRVQRFDFRRITFNGIVKRLMYILDEEDKECGNIIYDVEAVEYLAKLADGGMRDAITLMDKCISYNPDLTIQTIIEALGTVDYETMVKLTEDTITANKTGIINEVEQAYRSGVDLKQFMKQYSWFLLDIYKYHLTKSFEFMQIPPTYEKEIQGLVSNPQLVLELMNEVLQLNNVIKWEPAPKPLIESTLLLFTQRVEEM